MRILRPFIVTPLLLLTLGAAPARPELSEAAYKARAAELRAAYARPPAEWPAATVDPGVAYAELGPLPKVEFPKENPFSKEKARLGYELFFDPRLSGSGTIACASCHDPDLGWADGRTVSFGHGRQATRRNAPSILNAGVNPGKQFWDGRAESLEAQVRGPVLAEDEMHGDAGEIVRRLAAEAGYPEQFKAAFGDERVDMGRVAQAIATFERSIVGGRSRFDAFLRGKAEALSDSAVRGLHLFRTEGRCANCHNGPNLTDNQFHDLGLSFYGRKLQDLGRYEVTRDPKDVGAFRTPSLRNVTRTGPYMHNGLFELRGVLNLYNAGMPTLRRKEGQERDPLFPTKSALLKPLGLNRQDMEDLMAFLESLEEPRLRIRPPELPGRAGPATEPTDP